MRRFDLAKVLFYAVGTVIALGSAFAFGLYSGVHQTMVYEFVRDLSLTVGASVKTLQVEATTMTGLRPDHFLQPARFDGNGVTINDAANDSGELILLAGFFADTNELRVIRRDGTILARWPVRFFEIFPNTDHLQNAPKTDWNVDTHGVVALPDGAIIFNFDNAGLVKLDRCGAAVWKLARPTHHSVERAQGGGFWVPSRRYWASDKSSPFPPFETPFMEDTILRVSDDGEVLNEISVPRLFYENGLQALLTATGESFMPGMVWGREIVHLNKIEELTSEIAAEFPMFESGDLALSLRQQNLIIVIEPTTRRVKWRQTGPWVRQHDPEFAPGGRMFVFNNNLTRMAFGRKQEYSALTIPRVSNIMEVDFTTGRTTVVYGGDKDQEMLSVVRGKVDVTKEGHLFITEFEGGRVFEVDGDGRIVWQFINRYDQDWVAEITEARVYPRNYFDIDDWSCDKAAH